jgi:hypothetical protein
MTTELRTGVRLRCRWCQVGVVRPVSAPPRSVPPRFRSTEDSAARLRFRIIMGLVRRRRRFRSRLSCTSSLPLGRTLRPTSRMTPWAARGRARQAPHRGVSAAALDSKSPDVCSLKPDGLIVVVATVRLDTWTIFNWTRRMWSHRHGIRPLIGL